MLIILWLGENSGFKGSNEGNTLLYQLFISTIWSLIYSCYCLVRELSDKVCCIDSRFGLTFMKEQRMWFAGRECIWSCNLPLSFCKWRSMGINPTIASMPSKEKSIWPLFFAIFLASLTGMTIELYDNTIVGICREQWAWHNFYREGVSDGGSILLLNYQGFSYIWQ